MISIKEIQDIEVAIKADRLNDARQILAKATPEEARGVIERLPDSVAGVAFRLLDRDTMLEVFERLERDNQSELLRRMTDDDALKILNRLETDETIQLFEELPAKVTKRLLGQLTAERLKEVDKILGYEDGTCGRRMNPHPFTARRPHTVKETLEAIKASALDAEDLDIVFVIDRERFFHGYVQVADLLKADPETKMVTLAESPGSIVRTNEDEQRAVRVLQKADLPAIAVLDQENRLVGALASEDLMDVAQQEASEWMYQKAGVRDISSKKDHTFSRRLTQGNILYPVRVRLLFLLITLFGGLMVGGIIDHFEGTLEAIIVAAVFIPLVMDMGGNVGTQSTTIFARGFALGHIRLRRFWSYLLREGSIGLTIGVLLGALGGTIAYFWQGVPNDVPAIGLAVGISLTVVITFASMLGFLLPYILIKLGFDHAPGADPFITTIKDFTGLALYFFLVATLIGTPEELDEDLLEEAFNPPAIEWVVGT
ncbi:MAG: magnesium transporter [Opitutales bacterium]|nr:magnesium transporter [Opitutales bacterium]